MHKNFHHGLPLLALLAILLLASALRFYGLDTQSMWNDELNSWGIATAGSGLLGVLENIPREGVGVHPPGYYLVLHATTQVLGESVWALRFPSAVAGILSVLVVYVLGQKLYSWREGLIAALMMAVLWTPIYYSQEARMYSLLLLFTSLATYFLVSMMRNLDRESRPGLLVASGYVVAAVASSYLHYFGFYLIALQGLWVALLYLRRPGMLAYVLLVYGSIVLAYSPWLPALFGRTGQGAGTISHIGAPGPAALVEYLEFLFNRSTVLVLAALALYLSLLLKNLRAFFGSSRTGEHRNMASWLRSPGLLLALWLVVPFAGAYVASLVWTPILEPRYLIISLPAAYLLVARVFVQLPLRPVLQGAAVALGTIVVLSMLIFSMDYYSKPNKEQIREAVGFAAENERPGSLIAYCAGVRPQFFDYYLVQNGSDLRFQVRACETERDLERAIEEGDYDYVLFVASREPEERVTDYLRTELELVREENLVRADSYLFEVT